MEVFDTLDFLLGDWHVDRSITDHRSRTRGSFTGRATIALVGIERGDIRPARAEYAEMGTLSFGTHTGPASRHLEYVRTDGSAVMIYFADRRPFVDLDLKSGQWGSVHPCGEDRYELTTTVLSHDAVEERWLVQGPGKSYSAVTMLTRMGAALR